MPEWWTYSPSDFLMFSARTYYRLVELHNRRLWPAHLAAAFAVQAIGLLCVAALGQRRDAPVGSRRFQRIGVTIVALAVVAQPLIGSLAGRPWMQGELFGLTPDPTVTATLGVLLAIPEGGWRLWVIPVAWSLFSGMTLWTLGSTDAFVMPLVALLSVVLGVSRRPRDVSARPIE